MKRSTALIATLALSMGAIATVQDTVTLTRTFTEGQTDKYSLSVKTDTTTDLSAMGQGEMQMTFDMSQIVSYTFSNVKDGAADVKFKYSDIKMKLDGPMAEMMGGAQDQMPKEMTGSFKMDKLGKITGFKMDNEQAAGMMAMFGGGSSQGDPMSFFAFPKDGVKIGDTFTMELPPMPMFEKDKSKVTGKIVGEEKVMDMDAYKIEVTGDMKMNFDMGEAMRRSGSSEMPQMNMVMTGDVKSKGTTYVEKATGRILVMESVTSTDGVVKLSDMGLEIPTKTTTITNMKLVK